MKLSAGDLTLLMKILEMASERMSCAGCNDTDKEWLADYTDSELAEVHKIIESQTSGFIPGAYSRSRPAADFQYLGYLESRLGKAFQET